MRRVIVASVALFVTLSSTQLAAQDREQARRVFEEATRQFEQGNHSLALDGFVRSRAMLEGDTRARALILFNIARAQEELQRYDEALQSFEQYLADAPPDAPYREQTLDRVRELRVRVSSRRGQETSPLMVAGALVAGLGGLTALGAIPTGVLALDATSRLEQTCAGTTCPQTSVGLRDEAQSLGLATDVLWITGLSVAVIGAALLLVGVSTSDAPQAGAACTGEGCAATLSVHF